MTRSFEPREDPDVDSVWRWFEFQSGLIREERERILRIDTLGGGIDVGLFARMSCHSPASHGKKL